MYKEKEPENGKMKLKETIFLCLFDSIDNSSFKVVIATIIG